MWANQMEYTNLIYASVAVALTTVILLQFSKKEQRKSVKMQVDGDEVIRAAYFSESLVKSASNITTMHESFM